MGIERSKRYLSRAFMERCSHWKDAIMSLDFRLDDQPELTVETLKQVLAPIEKARGLPNPCYTNAKAIELERQRVFAGGWACAGFAMDIPTRGDLYPFEFAGLPLFMARLADGSIRVYHNVCQHRGPDPCHGGEKCQESRRLSVSQLDLWSGRQADRDTSPRRAWETRVSRVQQGQHRAQPYSKRRMVRPRLR